LIFRPLPTDLPAFWWAVNHKASPAEKLSKGGCAARDLSQDLPHGGRHGKILEVFFDVLIVTLICVQLFSGKPAFDTKPAAPSPATATIGAS